MQNTCWEVLRTALIIVAFTALVSGQGWDRLSKLSPGERIQVIRTSEGVVDATFRGITAEVLTVERRNQVVSIPRDTIQQVLAVRKASRWKAVAIGSAIGFGAAFPIGAASAGYLTDRNSPGFGTRAKVGAGMGLFGAGIGAGIGALAGGTSHETLYRRK